VRHAALLLLLFCSAPAAGQGLWTFRPADEARQTGRFENPRLDESSGVAVSRRHPGLLWTQNDGSKPVVFATDTLGADRGRVALAVDVDDWEDIALGPCGSGTCLYLADTGDNRERRNSVRVHRLHEPTPEDMLGGRTLRAEVLHVRYPDGPHDVEAMWVDPNGDVQLVSKGRRSEIRQFRLPAASWRAGRAVAQPVGNVPIETQRFDRFVTGAAISPGGDLVALRTYSEIYFFARGPNGALTLPAAPIACDISGVDLQGEGVAWLDQQRLVLTSERAIRPAGSVSVVRCPLPPPTTTAHSTP
jgi:hypothetical protein